MENRIDNSPVTVHGDGTMTGSNINNLIQTNEKNKFLEKYNDNKKTDTEQLLQGLPEFIIKDMVLYYTISLIFLYGINNLLQNLNIMYNININNKRGSVNEV